jgi:uncharacterized GH25 family protein
MWMLAASAFAHDLWLEIDAEEAGFEVEGFIGEHLKEPEPYRLASADRVARFELVGPDSTMDMASAVETDRDRLASLPVVEGPGTYAVVLEMTPVTIALPAHTFDGYLAEEGLTDVQAAHEPGSVGRELYSRTVVSLVGVGPKGKVKKTGEVATEVKPDLALQLVPDTNPLLAKPGDDVTFRLLFAGEPVADRQVVAASRVGADDVREVVARTDADGNVTFTIDGGGYWIVRLVHMTPSVEPGADWRSYWAALTFPVAG